MIDVSNMWVQFFNEFLGNVITYRDDNLFVRRAFGSYWNPWLEIVVGSINDFLNLFDFVVQEA